MKSKSPTSENELTRVPETKILKKKKKRNAENIKILRLRKFRWSNEIGKVQCGEEMDGANLESKMMIG